MSYIYNMSTSIQQTRLSQSGEARPVKTKGEKDHELANTSNIDAGDVAPGAKKSSVAPSLDSYQQINRSPSEKDADSNTQEAQKLQHPVDFNDMLGQVNMEDPGDSFKRMDTDRHWTPVDLRFVKKVINHIGHGEIEEVLDDFETGHLI